MHLPSQKCEVHFVPYAWVPYMYGMKRTCTLGLRRCDAVMAGLTLIAKIYKLSLKAPITTAADDKFCKIFPNSWKKIRYISWESSASRRFSWNIMPYLLFLKKQQNLQIIGRDFSQFWSSRQTLPGNWPKSLLSSITYGPICKSSWHRGKSRWLFLPAAAS